MRLQEWRDYKKQCAAYKTKPKAHIRCEVYYRLFEMYGELVMQHISWIAKILDR